MRFNTDIGMRVPAKPKAMMRHRAGIVQASGDGYADIVRGARIDAAEIALIELNAFVTRIDARPHGHAVQGDALLVGRSRRAKMIGSITEIAALTPSNQMPFCSGEPSRIARIVNWLPPEWT